MIPNNQDTPAYPVEIGSHVVFYDCSEANKDRDSSGKNRKYWPVGEVIKLHKSKSGEPVADIQLPDGRISKSHFVSGLKPALLSQLNPTKP